MTGSTVSNNPEFYDQYDDAITITDESLVPRLAAKRSEYYQRLIDSGAAFMHPDVQLATGDALNALKLHVLDAVLDVDKKIPGQSVSKTDVATYVTERTGYHLNAFLQTPPKYNEDTMLWGPDISAIDAACDENWFSQRPIDRLANNYMAHAYWIIRTYASGSQWGIEGGTGLPVLPLTELDSAAIEAQNHPLF
jgi:hypothetical protein